jgi:hypothetical protein
MVKTIEDVGTTNAFTLLEGCPEARCRDSRLAPARVFAAPGPCRHCGGKGHRATAFDSLADLQRYAAAPPSW